MKAEMGAHVLPKQMLLVSATSDAFPGNVTRSDDKKPLERPARQNRRVLRRVNEAPFRARVGAGRTADAIVRIRDRHHFCVVVVVIL